MEGRRLVFGWRRWEKGLGVFGEILGTVRRVKAFREHDQGGSRLCSLEDLGASVGEIDGFVGACEGWFSLGDLSGAARENLPDASCTQASFKGFFKSDAMMDG